MDLLRIVLFVFVLAVVYVVLMRAEVDQPRESPCMAETRLAHERQTGKG